MKCQRCGKEMGNSNRCSFCGFENFEEKNVREMSRAEKNFYNGVTIDVSDNEKSDEHKFNSEYTVHSQGTYTYGDNFFFNLLDKFIGALFRGNILAKVIAGLIFLAILAFLFFVALPIFFVMMAVVFVALILVPRIKNRFRGRF